MDTTIKYYDDNAEAFIKSSINADMSTLYKEFLRFIPEGGRILDAGCGSGRDSKFFLEQGYRVEAFDASGVMCKAAQAYSGLNVSQNTFDTYSTQTKFDGIWMCASLLHIPLRDTKRTINKYVGFLKDEGVLYCSWKLGNHEHVIDGKYYNDIEPDWIMKNLSHKIIGKIWISCDCRPYYQEKWLNVLFINRKEK